MTTEKISEKTIKVGDTFSIHEVVYRNNDEGDIFETVRYTVHNARTQESTGGSFGELSAAEDYMRLRDEEWVKMGTGWQQEAIADAKAYRAAVEAGAFDYSDGDN